ncbi:U3 small nucleolar RNA-associated protein 3 [Trypanosoma vivax]|nr:U3 small nucleolar RNA-associated protein 3 [Trypanosoma vivax]
MELNKNMRRRTIDADFDVGGLSAGARRKRKGADLAQAVAPAIEAVERDYAALSSSERLAIVQKESPEMVKMLEEMKRYLSEVEELARPLQELFFQRRLSTADQNLVQFLETKVQLMLSYCMHVLFYLLMKMEGKKVAGHPVIDNLVEIRVYLEKLFQLEERLQYSLNRLLSGKAPSAAHVDSLRPVQRNERIPQSTNNEAKMNRKKLEAAKKAEDVEREEMTTMNRIQSKKSDLLNDEQPFDRKTAVSMLSYHEDEDQLFSRLAGDSDDDDDGDRGATLIERLRKRQRALTENDGKSRTHENGDGRGARGVVADDDSNFCEEIDEEGEMLSEGESEGEGDYEVLLEEEQNRKRMRMAESKPAVRFVEPEVDRRKNTKNIENHRGLTKPRPRDRKTPRTAQRRKYEKGMRIHKAQVRTVRPEPEGGFVGVPSIKSGVTQSIRF